MSEQEQFTAMHVLLAELIADNGTNRNGGKHWKPRAAQIGIDGQRKDMQSISPVIELGLGFISICLSYLLWRANRRNVMLKNDIIRLQHRITVLEEQLQEALQRIYEYEETNSTTDGVLEKAVQGLVALGIPGLVLLVAVSTSGFAGAAALTTALSGLGGPLGMIGGIGVLLLLVLVSRVLAVYGFPKISKLVIRGLLASGYSMDAIRTDVGKYPSWVITWGLRNEIEGVLRENQNGDGNTAKGL